MPDEPRANESASTMDLAPGVTVDESALRMGYSRSSGPGGQNVNKLNTRAEVWVPIHAIRGLPPDALERLMLLAGKRLTRENELHLVAETSRTQEGNRQAVLEKVRQLVRSALLRPKTRRKTRPSRASKQRRLEGKRRRSEIKARRSGPVHRE
jgi:ribosome-associated protein